MLTLTLQGTGRYHSKTGRFDECASVAHWRDKVGTISVEAREEPPLSVSNIPMRANFAGSSFKT